MCAVISDPNMYVQMHTPVSIKLKTYYAAHDYKMMTMLIKIIIFTLDQFCTVVFHSSNFNQQR